MFLVLGKRFSIHLVVPKKPTPNIPHAHAVLYVPVPPHTGTIRVPSNPLDIVDLYGYTHMMWSSSCGSLMLKPCRVA